MLEVAEGAVHEAGSELPTGDEEGVNRHQLAPEVGRGGLSDVHRHRHAGDACGERKTQGEEVISRRFVMGEEMAFLYDSCFMCYCMGFFFLYLLPECSSVFFFYKNMLIITNTQLIKSNPETVFSDVADFTSFYAFHYFQFFPDLKSNFRSERKNDNDFFFQE